MIQIPMNSSPIYNRTTVLSMNKPPTKPYSKATIGNIGKKQAAVVTAPQEFKPAKMPSLKMPDLLNVLHKGQKMPIDPSGRGVSRIKACFGWNISDQRCDLDASAFLIGANGRVHDDSWFVFYGQPESPDGSVKFMVNSGSIDRETIYIDLKKVNPIVTKIVFVLTINEAFEQNLNFSMVTDTYVRNLEDASNKELMSYRLEENYANVTSMTVAELYLHNGAWKFNPVGNGIHDDLAGQCSKYGVQIG